MGYYGISNSADRLGGDIFITTLISALVEYPAYIICFFVVGHPKIGRKYSMATCFFLTGVSLCACIPLLLNPGRSYPFDIYYILSSSQSVILGLKKLIVFNLQAYCGSTIILCVTNVFIPAAID